MFFSRPSLAVCPDLAVGESLQDCPWAEIARAPEFLPALQSEAPGLLRQIRAADALASWKALWGQSINFDELAKNEIVRPDILRAISAAMGVPMPRLREMPTPSGTANRLISHAGMEHTYGYLFSVLRTSFGYKRARWVQGEVEHGFGLSPGLFGPVPPSGSLFANVTYFAGRIAFRDDPKQLQILSDDGAAAEELRRFDFSQLRPIRVEERVPGLVIRTDLVPFTHPSGSGDSYWLVYSFVDKDGPKLVTAFPVEQSFVESVADPTGLGDNKPIATRYNGYVAGFSGRTWMGTRRVVR